MKKKRAVKAQSIIDFRDSLEKQTEDITEWNQSLWNSSVDEALVHTNNTIEFKFYSGISVVEDIE